MTGVPALVGAVLVLLGALFALAAAIGLLRLPDVLSRLHAATKPQTTGLVLVAVGAGLLLGRGPDRWMLALTGLFALLTAPVTAHLVGSLAYRTGGVRRDLLDRDELATTEPDDRATTEPDDRATTKPDDRAGTDRGDRDGA